MDIWGERSALFTLSGFEFRPYYTYNAPDSFLNTKECSWNVEFSDESTQEEYKLSLYCLNDSPGDIAFATLDEMQCNMLHKQDRTTTMILSSVQVYMAHADDKLVFAVLIPESMDFDFNHMGACTVSVKDGNGQDYWEYVSRDIYLSNDT